MHRHEFSCSLVPFISLINFKNNPGYLKRGTAQVFIPLMRFQQCSLVSSSFLVLFYFLIIAITNITSPWKIPLWIFTSVKLFPLVVSSPRQFCMVFSIKLVTSLDISYILRQSIIQLWGSYTLFCCQSITWLDFVVSFCCPRGSVDQCIVAHLFLPSRLES